MASIYHPSIVPDQYRAVDKIFGLGVLIGLPKAARPAGSAAPGIGKGVRGHAPPENFEILRCLKRILRQV